MEEMDSKIYLSCLLYKSIISEGTCTQVTYKVIGPMMGTIENNIFINTHDRKYYSIDNPNTSIKKDIRYAYYNSISLQEAKEKYKTDNIEELVSKYYETYKKQNANYYVIVKRGIDPMIIAYDPEKFKRKYESNVAKPI